MSETDTGFDALTGGDAPPIPVREGLPTAYRMRADAHYVDQLESGSPGSPIRFVDPKAIDIRGEDPQLAAGFVESIKRHGVLQPLLVHGRAGRYRLIAGRKRLAAALAAGLRDVPCLVQRVDEDQAGVLAEATNVPALEPQFAAAAIPGASAAEAAAGELVQSLSALASSANLLSGGSALTHVVAIDLVRAEAGRALQLLLASRVLCNQVAMARARVPLRHVLDRAAQATAAERRLRGVELTLNLDGHRHAMVRGDEELLTGAVVGLLMATIALMPATDSRSVTLSTDVLPDARIAVHVSQDAVMVPEQWLLRAFDVAWPLASGGPGALVMLQAAQRIAQLHGGEARATRAGGGTALSLMLPTLIREM